MISITVERGNSMHHSASPTETSVGPPESFTTAEVAARWKTNRDKVLGFIRDGELPAINLSRGSERPRFRIRREDLETFEKSRLVASPTKPTQRRRSANSSVKEYFSWPIRKTNGAGRKRPTLTTIKKLTPNVRHVPVHIN